MNASTQELEAEGRERERERERDEREQNKPRLVDSVFPAGLPGFGKGKQVPVCAVVERYLRARRTLDSTSALACLIPSG